MAQRREAHLSQKGFHWAVTVFAFYAVS